MTRAPGSHCIVCARDIGGNAVDSPLGPNSNAVYDPVNEAGPFCSSACMESRRGAPVVISQDQG